MSKSTKKLISQRWEKEFADRVKKTASGLGINSTELTVESLQFMIDLISQQPTLMLDNDQRAEYLKSIIVGDLFKNDLTKSGTKISSKQQVGYITDRIADYLKKHNNTTFSTTELAKILQIPQPTVRTYIRNLANSNKKYRIIQGRPNFIGYYQSL